MCAPAALLTCLRLAAVSQPALQERTNMITIHKLEWRLAHGVVPAGEHDHVVVDAVAADSSYGVPGKLRQKRGIVGRIDELGLLCNTGEFFDIVHWADRHPDFAQLVDIDMALHPLPHM